MPAVNKRQQDAELELKAAASNYAAARRRRDTAIRKAAKAGLTMRAIGEGIGLSAARVQRIIKGN